MRTYTQLTLSQRYQIHAGIQNNISQALIARNVGVHPSTISRELKRCLGKYMYQPEKAHDQAIGIRHTAHRRKHITGDLKTLINSRLKANFSPEQISGTLKLCCCASVSFQSIYRYIQRDNWYGGTLFKHLPRIRKQKDYLFPNKRKVKNSQGPVANRIFIDNRPAIVDAKSRIGDLEIDTVIGAQHKSAILTINDRYSRFLFVSKLSSKSAKAVRRATLSTLDYYKDRFHTITSDNGSEFALHQDIADRLNIDFYFAHPYSSWERGANENTNGLLRRHFPKKTDFNKVGNTKLQDVVFRLNNTPRKCLGFRTPAEVFFGREPYWLKDIPVALIG